MTVLSVGRADPAAALGQRAGNEQHQFLWGVESEILFDRRCAAVGHLTERRE
jgi:hypothetical protein